MRRTRWEQLAIVAWSVRLLFVSIRVFIDPAALIGHEVCLGT
jgi:hypothetical protein